MNINDFAATVHRNAVEHGFWTKHEWLLDLVPRSETDTMMGLIVSQKLALIHSETSEALEEVREHSPMYSYYREDGKPEGAGYELADAVIRLLDLMLWLGYDVEKVLAEKHEFNTSRPKMHGKRF